MKTRFWNPEYWLLLVAGLLFFLVFSFITKPSKPNIPTDPPKLVDVQVDGCFYFWFKNWDGNFNIVHKSSCTNIIHRPHIAIQFQQPPSRGLQAIY